MNTTQLFVELLVIGSGAAVAFLILLISSQTINISFISSLISLIPIIAVIYILGILTDRISRFLFCPLENYIERIQKHKNSQDFEIIKCKIIGKSEHYKAEIVYNRSRVRVCRGWVINFLLIGFSLAKSGFNKLAICSFALVLLSLLVWYLLTRDYYRNLISSYRLLFPDES